MKKVNVSVGFVAYNEEVRILDCVNSILNSRVNNYILEKIIIVSDGSTDATVSKVLNLANNDILLIKDTIRRGKATQLNKIFESNTSDLLILMDADCVLEHDAINIFVDNYLKNPGVSLFGGNYRYLVPQTIVSKAIAASINITGRMRSEWRGSDNAFNSVGRLLAMSKSLSDSIHIPPTSGNDAYIYLFAKKENLSFVYVPNAVAYYKIPVTVHDHYKQSSRHYVPKQRLRTFYGSDVDMYFKYPSDLILKDSIRELFYNPFFFLLYLCIQTYTLAKRALLGRTYKTDIWDIAYSTKINA